jgi:hypothetical protein
MTITYRRSLLSMSMSPLMIGASMGWLIFRDRRFRGIARFIAVTLIFIAQMAVGLHWAEHASRQTAITFEQDGREAPDGDADGPDCAICKAASATPVVAWTVAIAIIPFAFVVARRSSPVTSAISADPPASFRSRAPPR